MAGWQMASLACLAVCCTALLGLSFLVICQGPPFQTKVSQDQSVDCLIIYTLYSNLYSIQFKDAAFRDHKKTLGDCNPIVFTEVGESLTKEKDTAATYVREKPAKQHEQILNTFLTDKSLYAIDACSGSGSCGVACQSLGVKCLVL